jgi:4-hydroxy-3-methylbut-2-enyl diphosphate reductase
VNGVDEVPDDLHGVVGVTAGASAPEELVEAIITHLSPTHGVQEIRYTDEDEYFPPPRSLRELIDAVDLFATFTLGGPLDDRPGVNDRQTKASDVLAALPTSG